MKLPHAHWPPDVFSHSGLRNRHVKAHSHRLTNLPQHFIQGFRLSLLILGVCYNEFWCSFPFIQLIAPQIASPVSILTWISQLKRWSWGYPCLCNPKLTLFPFCSRVTVLSSRPFTASKSIPTSSAHLLNVSRASTFLKTRDQLPFKFKESEF